MIGVDTNPPTSEVLDDRFGFLVSDKNQRTPTNRRNLMRRLLAATLTLLITPYAAAATTPQQVTAGPSLLVGGWRILTACSNNHVVALFATPLAPRSGENFRSVAFQPKTTEEPTPGPACVVVNLQTSPRPVRGH